LQGIVGDGQRQPHFRRNTNRGGADAQGGVGR
jgi:hypothetical protein